MAGARETHTHVGAMSAILFYLDTQYKLKVAIYVHVHSENGNGLCQNSKRICESKTLTSLPQKKKGDEMLITGSCNNSVVSENEPNTTANTPK